MSPGSMGYFSEVSYDDRGTWDNVRNTYGESERYNSDCSVTDGRVLLPLSVSTPNMYDFFI